MKSSQLPLNLHVADDATFANFFLGSNAALITELKACSEGKLFHMFYIWGKHSAGCSHLLQACCHEAFEYHRTATYISLLNVQTLSPELLEGLENLNLVCLDDVDTIAGNALWEEALFDLYNRCREKSCSLIIAGQVAPAQLGLKLADLQTRLTWDLVFQVHELTDEEKGEALQMRARNRGLSLSSEVIHYLLTHFSRDMMALYELLERLDKITLVEQRRVTVPLVKEILKK
ncbi:MAG: DnaA regulatory inactivator Hda [Proteobacteria bacterium]|nr:DnaA regulatory inactivator Hda [Pseudomonadota bacterium]